MNFGQMQAKVRRKIDELTSAFYSDADIREALNEGYAELADATEFHEREAMIPMLKKRTYYDLSRILQTDTFLSPRRVYNVTTSRWLDAADTNELDYHTYVQWELTEGPPEKYIMRGNWWLGVFPKPMLDSVGLRFYYTAIPPALDRTTDEPEFPQEFHEGLVNYALCDLLGQERETKKALAYWAAYQKQETALKAYTEGRTILAQSSVIGG